MTQKVYAVVDNVRDLIGAPETDQISDSILQGLCVFGSAYVDQKTFRENIADDDEQYSLFQQASELYAASMGLKRLGAERFQDSQAAWDMANQICDNIVASNATDENVEEDLESSTVESEYTTYPANPDGQYYSGTTVRRRSDYIYSNSDIHHDLI